MIQQAYQPAGGPGAAASRGRGPGAAASRSAGIPEAAFLRDMIGASPKMQRIFRLVSKVAATESTVLITGESGTGKELVARSIHLQSRRASAPFVPVNIGAVPETLLESELFGAARGAFTGAAVDRAGLIEAADHGTLFLDEVGDMPLVTQVKLLRTLENNEVRRLGDQQLRMVDVRVIAATHRDLQVEIEAGRFRADLYYRLNVVQIALPPLRERREDIGLLASYFLEQNAAREGRPKLGFSPEAEAALERYDWPGNVRELQNAVAHAVAVSDGDVVQAPDLPPAVRAPRLLPRQEEAAVSPDGVVPRPRETWSLAEVEKEHIARVLARHHANTTAAAKQLGISRTTLWRKLRRYGLKRLANP
ncbi:MAG TPA: sigma 54-interacting transcriptional regulator [Candidatus Eisenbacteria bacterium]|nr:sigma 54-interacting transcriptional regulator [Candidatus Eisenbacteria bacterium]